MAGTEPAFYRARKPPTIFLLHFERPRLGRRPQPTFTLCFPLAEQLWRNRVSESKSDKMSSALSLLVGQRLYL